LIFNVYVVGNGKLDLLELQHGKFGGKRDLCHWQIWRESGSSATPRRDSCKAIARDEEEGYVVM